MTGNVHLRFLGVFQPGPQIGQRFASLTCGSNLPGLHHIAQPGHHFANGPQFLRYGNALSLKRIPFFLCSYEYHPNPCPLC